MGVCAATEFCDKAGPARLFYSCTALEAKYNVQKRRQGALKPLGVGAFSEVWPASERATDTRCVIKCLPRGLTTWSEVVKEVEFLRTCAHANVVEIREAFADCSTFYIVMQYCEWSLDDRIETNEETPEILASWAAQVLRAVAYLHTTHVCHRDIKPQNFLINEDDADSPVKLADFGVSLVLEPNEFITEQTGTPAYMPPEWHQLPHGNGYSLSLDIWSSGLLIYLLTNRNLHPFIEGEGTKDQALMIDSLNRGEIQQGGLVSRTVSGLAKRASQSHVGKRLSQMGMGEDNSATSINLVERMLMPHPEQRLSAAGALAHPWFENMGIKTGYSDTAMEALAKDVGEKLIPYGRGNWMKESALNG